MLTAALALLYVASAAPDLDPGWVKQRPITWNAERERLTREYRRVHYGEEGAKSEISPTVIVLHHTAIDTLEGSFKAFDGVRLPSFRKAIGKASPLNVSVQFLVDQDGSVYRLMPDTRMGRHTIGLNWTSVGIENVGGKDKPLTAAQVEANVRLIRLLKERHPAIRYLIGHHEYAGYRGTALWKEKDAGYLTSKVDPGEGFMNAVRSKLEDLKLQRFPDEAQRLDFSQGSTARLEKDALRSKSLRELGILRNEIFARHGRPFHTPWVAEHFRAQSWYRVNPRYDDALLTDLDKENVATLLAVEKSFTAAELRLKRNEVFARRGRVFKSDDLRAHFGKQPWYKPDPAYSDARLTAEDKVELELIQARERVLSSTSGFGGWKPGQRLELAELESLSVEQLFRFYDRMHGALSLERAGDCGFLADITEEAWALCERPKRPVKRSALSDVDRMTLLAVEKALAVALVNDEYAHATQSCADECMVNIGECERCARCDKLAATKQAACYDDCEPKCMAECESECARVHGDRNQTVAKQKRADVERARAAVPDSGVLIEKSQWVLTRGFSGA